MTSELDVEQWAYTEYAHGRYKVSDRARVWSVVKKRLMSIGPNGTGYHCVCLRDGDGGRRTFRIHRLVAIAFIAPVEGCNQVNHKDGDKSNNTAMNLEWVNQSTNIQHAYATGLMGGDGV